MKKHIKDLILEYKKKKKSIKVRLKEFSGIHKGKEKDIFPELCFCILTPQSNARNCDAAIQELKKRGLLFKGSVNAIRPILKGRSRFHNKKACYIVGARKLFGKKIFNDPDAFEARERIVKNVKGVGYKEASHFLRNIGLGADMAILDRHILKNLKKYGVIEEIPGSIGPTVYLDIEERARFFARKVRIPLEELDLLFWSKETGEIFK